MRELSKEFGLFVVLEVNVARGEVDLETGESGCGTNLAVPRSDRARYLVLATTRLTRLPLPCSGVV